MYRYQEKVLEIAKRKNTIAVLETGAGKTMIAVLLIKHIADQHIIKSTGHKKLIIFMAPTVHLVIQVIPLIEFLTSSYFVHNVLYLDDNCFSTFQERHCFLKKHSHLGITCINFYGTFYSNAESSS